MPWGRCDDAHWRHRKVAALGDDLRKPCIGLFWLAVSWSNDNATDGKVTMTGLRQMDGSREEADELVRVGLWERDGNAYRIHDFLDYNKSAEQVAEDRAKRTLAGIAGADARWHSDSTSHGKSHAIGHGKPDGTVLSKMDAPYPVSRTPVFPAPNARDGLPHIDADAISFLETLTGRSITTAGSKNLAEYDRQIEEHGFPAVRAAYEKVAKGTARANPQARQVVWSALRILEPFVTPQDVKRIETQDRASEEERAHRARLEATRRLIAKQRGDAA